MGGGSRARAWEADRAHRARRRTLRPVAPGISPRKSKGGLGKQRCFGGGCVRCLVIANTITFTGRRLDDETGLFYYRNRYYHAQLGRFVTRDPLGYEGSEWNLYEYVKSKPLSLADPLGLAAYDVESCKTELDICNRNCLQKHSGFLVSHSLVDCYNECDTQHGKCIDKVTCDSVAAAPSCKCAKCDFATCWDTLRKIRDMASRVPTPGGLNKCQKWANAAVDVLGRFGLNPCVSEVKMVHFGWFCPPVDFAYSPGHAAIQITMCDGTNYYADYGLTSIGGKDRIGTDDDIMCWHFPH